MPIMEENHLSSIVNLTQLETASANSVPIRAAEWLACNTGTPPFADVVMRASVFGMLIADKKGDRQQPASCPPIDGASQEIPKVVARMYPELNKNDRSVAEANLISYVTIALAISNQPHRDAVHLTYSKSISRIKERSIDNLKS
jgi:hypothetical protein